MDLGRAEETHRRGDRLVERVRAQPTISSIEADRISRGVERAEKLARALKVHPAVLLWPNGWHTSAEAKRAG